MAGAESKQHSLLELNRDYWQRVGGSANTIGCFTPAVATQGSWGMGGIPLLVGPMTQILCPTTGRIYVFMVNASLPHYWFGDMGQLHTSFQSTGLFGNQKMHLEAVSAGHPSGLEQPRNLRVFPVWGCSSSNHDSCSRVYS